MGSLPKGFPKDFPLYAGAVPIGGSESAGGIVASLETPDGFTAVADFYRKALPGSPWKITNESQTAGQEAVLFTLSHENEQGRGGTVSVVRTPDAAKTLIYISLSASQNASGGG